MVFSQQCADGVGVGCWKEANDLSRDVVDVSADGTALGTQLFDLFGLVGLYCQRNPSQSPQWGATRP